MSRLALMSAAAVASLFAQESNDTLVTLLTISGTGIATPIRLADNYDQRISETATDVNYGITSNGDDYIFLPFKITLPSEEAQSAPRCTITINDVTRYLIPTLRTITTAPSVQIDLVLKSTPDTIEASFGSFLMTNITYNADSISVELVVESLAIEPFPSHTFTPSYFPGLF